jgi:hypothetical protein
MRKFLIIVAALFLGATAFAQTPAPKDTGEGKAFTVDGEVNFLSAYFYRGVKTQDEGLIVQPDITLSFRTYKSNALEITPYVELWGNVTDQNGDKWDELDVYGGVHFQIERFTFTTQYSYQTSPADAFKDIHEVSFVLEFNDADVNRLPFALNPHIGFYQEIDNPNKRSENTYLEFGIAPEFKVEKLPVTLTLPVTLGTSLNHYYESGNGNNSFFGYASVGLDARYDINDHWYIHGGVEYLQLLANNARAANGGDSNEVIGMVGVGFSF